MNHSKTREILSRINSPADIRGLDPEMLPTLAAEARQFLIESILKNGGHFSGNLGVVELTIALHYLLNLPDDTLIWDVGHQSYLHKIFTGRIKDFDRIRKHGGLSGFPKMAESEFDAFGTGHSSTSISACLGMAEADRLNGVDRKHVAVIGDGSLTGGMAWEALNNAGISKADITVVINDNQIGIDANDGSLGIMLNEILPGRPNVFTMMGLSYFGPVDGHNLEQLIPMLRMALEQGKPSVVHVRTVKGKGYDEAEKEQTKWHAVKYVKIGPQGNGGVYNGPKYQEVFGDTLCDLAEKDPKIIGITPAMPSGSSMDRMMKKMPDRTFDVGIAEQHALTFSAGLAAKGMKPFCNIYSTFLQRGYDQLIHDIGLQHLPVRLLIDRAGVVGEDGPTHHGLYDLVYLRSVPGLTIAAPLNGAELKGMMTMAANYDDGPVAIRYPRGRSPEFSDADIPVIERGKGRWLSTEGKAAMLTLGHVGNSAIQAAGMLEEEGISLAHVDMRFLKPVDEDIVLEAFDRFDILFTLEDGIVHGGFGSAVNDLAIKHQYKGRIINIGFPNEIIDQDSRAGQYGRYGLDPEGLARTIREVLG